MNIDLLAKDVYNVSHLTGEFTLRSGIVSNEYFDKYQFESDPDILARIADRMAALVPEGTDFLAGLEMGGIALVTALSLRTGIPAVFVRKKAKDYGTAKLAEGPDVSGKRLCIVEDVITSGGQVLLSGADLRDRGAFIDHVICAIDREQGGREKLREGGYTLLACFTMTELKSAGSSTADASEGSAA